MENQVVAVMQRDEEREESRPSRRRRLKMVRVDRTKRITLCVRIERLEVFGRGGSLLLRPFYYVVYWLEPENQFRSNVVQGSNHIWVDEEGFIWMGYNRYKYLYVEVMRIGPRPDPGTSYGVTLFARGRIPLPKRTKSVFTGVYDLVKRRDEDGLIRAQGRIQLTLKLAPVSDSEEED